MYLWFILHAVLNKLHLIYKNITKALVTHWKVFLLWLSTVTETYIYIALWDQTLPGTSALCNCVLQSELTSVRWLLFMLIPLLFICRTNLILAIVCKWAFQHCHLLILWFCTICKLVFEWMCMPCYLYQVYLCDFHKKDF